MQKFENDFGKEVLEKIEPFRSKASVNDVWFRQSAVPDKNIHAASHLLTFSLLYSDDERPFRASAEALHNAVFLLVRESLPEEFQKMSTVLALLKCADEEGFSVLDGMFARLPSGSTAKMQYDTFRLSAGNEAGSIIHTFCSFLWKQYGANWENKSKASKAPR